VLPLLTQCYRCRDTGVAAKLSWSAGVPDRWQIAHLLRTISATAAFDFLAAATTARHHGRHVIEEAATAP
jgi:hypothetical protein